MVGIYRPMQDSTLSTRGTKRGVWGVKERTAYSTWVLYDTRGVGGCPEKKMQDSTRTCRIIVP